MKTISKIILTLALVLVIFGLGGEKVDAGTYTIGNYTFTATHCNAQGVCHDPSKAEAKNVLAYAIGAGKMTYTHNMACGNTVKLVIKKCKVTHSCFDEDTLVTLNANCKRSTATCACGCSNGSCTTGCGTPNPDGDPNGNNPGDNNPPSTVTTTNSCPNGTTIFPSDYQRSIPSWALKSTKTYADCGVTPPPDTGDELLCPFPVNGTCPAPTITFTANPRLISKGGSCKLVWRVEGAGECELDGENVSVTGDERSPKPNETTVYKLTCSNGPAIASKIATCSVQEVDEQ